MLTEKDVLDIIWIFSGKLSKAKEEADLKIAGNHRIRMIEVDMLQKCYQAAFSDASACLGQTLAEFMDSQREGAANATTNG